MTFCSATAAPEKNILFIHKNPRAVAIQINPGVEKLLMEKQKSSTYGIVIFDFPTTVAIQASIRLNPGAGKYQFNFIPTGLFNDIINNGGGMGWSSGLK